MEGPGPVQLQQEVEELRVTAAKLWNQLIQRDEEIESLMDLLEVVEETLTYSCKVHPVK